MITRKSNPRAPLSAWAPRTLDPVKGVRGELHDALGGHRLIASEAQHEGLHNFTDELRTVFIGVARHGLGTIVRPFLFKSFHDGLNSQGGQPDHVAR